MTTPGHVDFYAIVLFIHIVAAVIAFGVTFAYPIIDGVARKLDPRSMPSVYEAQMAISRRLTAPAAVVVLVAGIYMATSDRWSNSSSGWWSGALVLLIVIVGLDHGFMVPNARRLRDLAALELQRSGSGSGDTVTFSAEYERLLRQRAAIGAVIWLLVVVALFVMVVKPGA
ncbi:MAG TPA: DUF2269 family protein [Conexibacter sp.]|jgi:hypothetical protein